MERPKTQAEVRKLEFDRRADHARMLAEEALNKIDEALEEGIISRDEHDQLSYATHCDLLDAWIAAE